MSRAAAIVSGIGAGLTLADRLAALVGARVTPANLASGKRAKAHKKLERAARIARRRPHRAEDLRAEAKQLLENAAEWQALTEAKP